MANVPIFEITDGTTTISLMNRTGFVLRDWSPSRPQYKGGGVRINSPLATGSALTMTEYTNIIDTFEIVSKHASQDLLIRESQDVDRLLLKAVNYWVADWQTDPVYLIARGPQETNIRYATIKSYAIPGTTNPYAQPFFSNIDDPGDTMLLTIEHGIWQADIPGSATCVETSAQQDYYKVDDDIYYPTESADDCFVTVGTAAITLAGATDAFGADAVNGSLHNGVRFRSVTIPVGATIVSAFIRYTSNNADASATCNADLYGESSIVPALFTTFVDFQARVRTTAKVDWDNIGAWVLATQYDTPDITALVQEIIDIGGWASGNNMCIFAQDDGSTAVARRFPASWDNVTYDEPELHVKWTAPTDITFGRSATCTDEVYVGNKQVQAQLTHIYRWRPGGLWSANLIGNGAAFSLWHNPVADNYMCYFGIDSAVPDSGPFGSLVFDISQASVYTGNADADWEYWNGAWVALDVMDGTTFDEDPSEEHNPFEETGVGSVHFRQPSDWDNTKDVNGVTGWWVRVVANIPVPPGDAIAPQPQHDGAARDVYTVVVSGVAIDSAEVLGDIPALLRIEAHGQTEWLEDEAQANVNLWISRVLVGLRSDARNPRPFYPYLGITANNQYPGGWFDPADPIPPEGWLWASGGYAGSTNIDDTTAATGDATQVDFAGITAMRPVGRGMIGGTTVLSYSGAFHCFLRYKCLAGADGDMQAQIAFSLGGSPVTTIVGNLMVGPDFQMVDLGRVSLPPASSPTTTFVEMSVYPYLSCLVAGAHQAWLYEVILIPADEWLGDFQCPIVTLPIPTPAILVKGRYLGIDSVTYPKRTATAWMSREPVWLGGEYASWLPYMAKPSILQPNAAQHLYFLMMQTTHPNTPVNRFYAPPGLAVTVLTTATARYLNMRGAR